jgi:hypothetical protein
MERWRADYSRFSWCTSLAYDRRGCSYQTLGSSTTIVVPDYLQDMEMVTQRSMKSQVAVAHRLILTVPAAGMAVTKKTEYDCLAISECVS